MGGSGGDAATDTNADGDAHDEEASGGHSQDAGDADTSADTKGDTAGDAGASGHPSDSGHDSDSPVKDTSTEEAAILLGDNCPGEQIVLTGTGTDPRTGSATGTTVGFNHNFALSCESM